ncbi:MAG: AAC(3) family N-acetyltransferase [Vallitaleaceae bacterium]|nr:AAC(3) family N-acetyltransferase [Vallitaleaceae bacterium]
MHGVEEWNNIPMRLTDAHHKLIILTSKGERIERPLRQINSPLGDVSQNYDKMFEPLIYKGIAKKGLIGDAESVLCDAVGMSNLTTSLLELNPNDGSLC